MSGNTVVRYGCTNLDPPYGDTIYGHPNGYVIVKERRTYSQRGIERGTRPDALESWEVYFHASPSRESAPRFWPWARQRMATQADSLREAAEWCHANPRSDWSSR